MHELVLKNIFLYIYDKESMINNQVPDFIQNLGSSSAKDPVLNNTSSQPVPDFIQNLGGDSMVEIDPKIKLTNNEIRNELWIQVDNSWSSNQQQVKDYIDNLSNEDYKTWSKLKEEWYSLDARKALFDNKDQLYDINKPWMKKYRSGNKNSFMEYLLESWQDVIDFQEDVIHPWAQSAQDWLDVQAQDLMNYSYDEIHQEQYNNALREWDNNLVQWLRRQATKPTAFAKREAAIAGWILFNMAKQAVWLIDELWNISTQINQVGLNALADERKWYDLITNDPSKKPNILWSYINAVSDTMGIAFTSKFPMATYILTSLGDKSKFVDWAMSWAHHTFKDAAKRVIETVGLDKFNAQYLTPEEQETLYNDIATWIFIFASALLGEGINRYTKSELYKNFEEAKNMAKETSKIWLQEGIDQIKETKEMLSKEPEGTTLETQGGKNLMTNTSNWIETSLLGKLKILQKLWSSQLNWWINGFKWYRQNRKTGLTTRNPNNPVGELPLVETPEIKEETDIIEKPKEEVKTPEEKIEIKETKVEKVKEESKNKWNETSSVVDFIKNTLWKISSKKGWLSVELQEKLKSDSDLQNAFVNTIEPWIRGNWAENPEWVIQEPLKSFVETVTEKIEERKNNNIDFRNGQLKYNVQQTPEQEIKFKENQKKLDNLLKAIKNKSDNPEKFLNYLLNLPEETVKWLQELIPEFTNNINYIKNILDITKWITSKDLMNKFLDYKSWFGSLRKWFIKRYLYKMLRDKYREQGVKFNLRQVENMLNKMSESELIELEKEMKTWVERPMMTDAEFEQFEQNWYMPRTWIPANKNIQEMMNEKWYGTDKTVWEFLKEHNIQISLGSPITLYRLMWGKAEAWYNGQLDRFLLKRWNNTKEWIIFHEFGHRLLNQLWTTQMMDIISYIAKRDKITERAAFERRAEYMRNYMQYNNIDGKKYLIENLGEDLVSKVEAVTKKTKDEIWDLFDIKDEKEFEINEIMSDVKHQTPKWEDILSRRPEPLEQDQVWSREPVRWEYLKTLDPNIKSVRTAENLGEEIRIDFEDWKSMKRSDYRKALTPEQLQEIDTYENNIIEEFVDEQMPIWKSRTKWKKGEWKFDYDKLENERDLDDLVNPQTKADLGIRWRRDSGELNKYKDIIKEQNPDIISLEMKDGELYATILMESFWERYELPDRPGFMEIKSVPVVDFFTDLQIEKLPKELQNLIKKSKRQSDEILERLQQEEWE